jgi:hypothetical protein
MNFLISKNQFQLISENISKNSFNDSCKKMNLFLKELVSEVLKKYDINLKTLLTWGPSIGGFLMPLDNFIKTGDFEVNETQRLLILAGIATTIFFDKIESTKKLIDLIKKEGILEIFKKVLSKAKKLKNSFVNFIISLKTSLNTFTDIISYAFLIPIISDIQLFSIGSLDKGEAATIIAKRLIASGAVVVSGTTLKEIIKKLLGTDSTQK